MPTKKKIEVEDGWKIGDPARFELEEGHEVTGLISRMNDDGTCSLKLVGGLNPQFSHRVPLEKLAKP